MAEAYEPDPHVTELLQAQHADLERRLSIARGISDEARAEADEALLMAARAHDRLESLRRLMETIGCEPLELVVKEA